MSCHVIVIVFVYSCIVFVDILSLLTMLMLDLLILLFVDATGWLLLHFRMPNARLLVQNLGRVRSHDDSVFNPLARNSR